MNAIVEPTWHDNSSGDSDQAEPTEGELDYEEKNKISVNEAIKWSLTPELFIQKYEDKMRLPSSPAMVCFCETDTKETRVAKLLTYYAVCHKLSGDNTTVVFIQKNKFFWLSNPYVIGGVLGILALVLLYRYQMR